MGGGGGIGGYGKRLVGAKEELPKREGELENMATDDII